MKNTIIRRIILLFFAGLLSLSCNAANQRPMRKQNVPLQRENILVTFVELGSVRCIPCKMMQPIMKDIEKDYAGQVKVVFHDVWTPEGEPFGQTYKIRVIPTQVFLDKEGKEYFRHEGFFPKDELVKILQAERREIMLEALFTWVTKLLYGHPLARAAGRFHLGNI